jgi:tetratricopeptide (TPR) repeat protein
MPVEMGINFRPVSNPAKQASCARLGHRPWLFLPGVLLALAGLLIPGPAMAQDEGGAYVSPQRMEDEYFNAIDRVEGEYGPYASELSDLYLGLGQALLNTEDYEQALDALHRGVLVVRVNSGPNSPEQINYLYLIANVLTLLGESEEAEGILRNIHFINWSHHGENNPELLPALERMYEWFLMARPPGSPIADDQDYQAVVQLTEEMAYVSETTKGLSHPDTATAYRRLGEAEFQLARHIMEDDEEAYMVFGVEAMEVTTDARSVARKRYDAGRRAFGKYLESLSANATNTTIDHARALVELGDWFLVFGKSRTARRHYEEAYQALAQSEKFAAAAGNFLDQPKPVYFFDPTASLSDEAKSALQDVRLDVSMTVTRSGEPRRVEVLEPPATLSEDDIEQVERQVREMFFRPALREGKVISTEHFIWRYEPQGAAASSG